MMKKQTIKDPSEASASEEKTNLCEWSFSVGHGLIKVLEKQQKQGRLVQTVLVEDCGFQFNSEAADEENSSTSLEIIALLICGNKCWNLSVSGLFSNCMHAAGVKVGQEGALLLRQQSEPCCRWEDHSGLV